ncbi:MAG: ATP-binding protein [Desulfovibrio desulfuricans]|nr:ATP-binding protein [Desulfovibrio desulfuricans]
MRITSLTLRNFRRYRDETTIAFDDLTVLVGKNDVGKSTILEALDIFFNDGTGCIKIDKDDVSKYQDGNIEEEIVISACFSDLPSTVIIDATNNTSLQDEYLLNENRELEIVKKYQNGGKAKIYIRAYHPRNQNCSDLLLKKDSELRKILDSLSIECSDRTKNAEMRKAIWEHFADDLHLETTEIDVSKSDAKSIWDKLQCYLPVFSLFQSDRKNTDSDNEVQDPLKNAVKEILSDERLTNTLSLIAETVENKLNEVASKTLEKLREMDSDVANSLSPVIPTASSLKWADVFKGVSITGDHNIPINKRGSGVKRLILLNFFRAEAERRLTEHSAPSIIYAIEEPETSQHTENQKKLINSLKSLAHAQNTQIIITTHSANIVKQLNYSNLRLITSDSDGNRSIIQQVNPQQLPYPSLNEINYAAFSEITEEYHNELYGFIEENNNLGLYKNNKATIPYIRKKRDGTYVTEQKVLTEYIRHQIHHPENTRNKKYTENELKKSIELMRDFISNHT